MFKVRVKGLGIHYTIRCRSTSAYISSQTQNSLEFCMLVLVLVLSGPCSCSNRPPISLPLQLNNKLPHSSMCVCTVRVCVCMCGLFTQILQWMKGGSITVVYTDWSEEQLGNKSVKLPQFPPIRSEMHIHPHDVPCVMLRSLPTARLHTLPRTLGGMPCHQRSLTRRDVHLVEFEMWEQI